MDGRWYDLGGVQSLEQIEVIGYVTSTVRNDTVRTIRRGRLKMTDTIIISSNGTTQSFSGSGNYIITGSTGNFTFGSGATVTVSGSGNTINGQPGDAISVWGSSNTIAGNGLSVGFNSAGGG